MSKNQVQQLVVVVLLLVFVGVWTLMRRSSAPAPATPAAPVPVQPAPAPATPAAAEIPEAPSATLVRNPFDLPASLMDRIRQQQEERKRAEEERRRLEEQRANPAIAPIIDLPDLKLQAVFWGTATPQAIINRKTVSVGDTLEGVKIVAISKSGVTVSLNGQETELKIENNLGKSRESYGQ